jgi:hypothetical protein
MTDLDDETLAARAFAQEARERKSRHRRRRGAAAPKGPRAWWSSGATAKTTGGVGPVTKTTDVPERLPDGPEEAPSLSLAQWLDAM